MTLNLEKLEADAKKAKPGPWISSDDAVPYDPRHKTPFVERGADIRTAYTDEVVIQGGMQDEQGGAVGVLSNEDAQHIMNCDPNTILELIKKIRELRRWQETVRQASELVGRAERAQALLKGLANWANNLATDDQLEKAGGMDTVAGGKWLSDAFDLLKKESLL